MESTLKLKASDGFYVYGTYNQASTISSSKGIIIFVHGISGNKDQPHFFNAVPYFNQKGFDTFRIDLYSDEDNGRVLSECSIKTHVADLDLYLKYFSDKYKTIYLVGHSLGATTIIHSDLSHVSKIVLWDPSQGMHSLEDKACEFNETLQKYILHWRLTLLVSKEMIGDWMNATDIEQQLSKIKKPCKFIFAESCEIYPAWEPYLKKLPFENAIALVPNATHDFIEEGVQEKLFHETVEWFDKQ